MRICMLWLGAVLALIVANTPARAEWWQAKTEHFTVYSESSEKDARNYAEKLERFDQALRSLQGIGPDEDLSESRRLTVFRFGDIRKIAALAGSSSSGIAGFYIPRASGPVAFVPAKEIIGKKSPIDAQTVFFHEYAHHFMYRYFMAAYPSWYVEGFAEVNSTIDLKDDGTFKLGAPPQSRANDFSQLNFSIKKMLLDGNKPDWEAFYARYSYGWLLVHYLTFEKSRAGQLQNYLKLINDGADAAAAANQAFGDLDRLESDVRQYRSRNRFPGAMVNPGTGWRPIVTMRRLGPDEEAIMGVRIRSERGVNRRSAQGVASDARRVAARNPDSLPVQLALLEAEFDAREYDAAERSAALALAIDPQSVKALLYKGYIYLDRAKKDPQHFATARSWFVKANQADTGHPSPLFYYYLSYTRAGVAPPDISVRGLERAFEMAPYDGDLRVALVRRLLVERQGTLARQLLMPLALSAHESKRAKAMHEVAELIDAGQVEQAIAKLDGRVAEEEEDKEKGKGGD